MNEGAPRMPGAKEMRADIFERESAARREKEDAILAQIEALDRVAAEERTAEHEGEKALLEATLKEIQEQQKRAEALFEAGR